MAAWPGSLSYVNSVDDILRIPRPRVLDTAKGLVDRLAAVVLGAMLAPIMLVCAVIIRLSSPGAVLIVQDRLGKNGKLFRMYKLRTMTRDAEAESGPVLASANDSRVIPACRWMRRSHLDEIPQLLNVLRGEMSLVGPRPERPEIAEGIYAHLPEFRHRLQVKPGITGLAQVRNGYDTCLDAVKRKLQYDLEYIRRRSWWLEVAILAATLTKLYDSSAR
ncbi:MAG: sugar transferase [Planctomycetes bacterium]|nr:sugar transferase [Planctomycetota bacterium]